jgi:hypothetical protein
VIARAFAGVDGEIGYSALRAERCAVAKNRRRYVDNASCFVTSALIRPRLAGRVVSAGLRLQLFPAGPGDARKHDRESCRADAR